MHEPACETEEERIAHDLAAPGICAAMTDFPCYYEGKWPPPWRTHAEAAKYLSVMSAYFDGPEYQALTSEKARHDHS